MKPLRLSRRTAAAALVSSLALNVFLLTAVGIRALKEGDHHRWSSIEAIAERFARRLPEEDAALLRRAFDARRGDLTARIEEYRITRDRLQRGMAAEPLSRPDLERAFADNRVAMCALQGAIQAAILDAAADLSADGRRRLFKKSGR
jgi:uncharacterized membrane protein